MFYITFSKAYDKQFIIYCLSHLETCVSQLKVEKSVSNIQRKKNDEVKQEHADSSNITGITEDSKKEALNTSNSDVTDSNEAEAKEIDANEVQLIDAEGVDAISCHANETPVTDDSTTDLSYTESTKELEKDDQVTATMDIKHSDNLIDEDTEIKQSLDTLDTNEEVKEKSSKDNEDLIEEDINVNSVIEVKEVIPLAIDEDNIQDEELDHEVDEEEIKGSTADFNEINDNVGLILNFILIQLLNLLIFSDLQEKSVQENNKDDNNEDSINLTIGEDDIKLFADEVII